MIGDVLLIEQKHERVARELSARIRRHDHQRLVVAIGGESGSGKSEIAESLRKVLHNEELRVKILHLDNYYKVPPSERTAYRRQHGMRSVGLHEIDWELLTENIESFRQGRHTTIPFLDLYTNQEDKLVTDFKKIDLVLVEGLYACEAEADIRVLIDLTYHDTRKAQLKRKKEKVDRFRFQVLEKEHTEVQSLRSKADYLVSPGFTVVDNTGHKDATPTPESEERIVFCSHQLPFLVNKRKNRYVFTERGGGVANAIGSVYQAYNSVWLGDLELPARASRSAANSVRKQLSEQHQCIPLYLQKTAKDADALCHHTLWPLFHYRPASCTFKEQDWQAYERYNKAFFDAISPHIQHNDTIWIHDYQLLLLPALIRKAFPDVSIGLFLHTPFPSFELFRILPWRSQILQGMLGADLIGFHIYEYTRHFQSCLFRILGLESKLGSVTTRDRIVHTDAFSLGVNFKAFQQMRTSKTFQRKVERLLEVTQGQKTVLAIDRLDPTRGIDAKLDMIESLLASHKTFRGKTLFLIRTFGERTSGPTRAYAQNIEKRIKTINNRYGKKDWTPIIHRHLQSDRQEIAALYNVADVLLVGSLRDGMNLICKEYVAAREGDRGVVVLSEFAGGARELSEAIIINPHDKVGSVKALASALTMPVRKQITTFARMRQRQQRNTALNWSVTFLESLRNIKTKQETIRSRNFNTKTAAGIMANYQSSRKRLLLLDYNGTLVPVPRDGRSKPPPAALLNTLERLENNAHNTVVLITDNSRELVESWFAKSSVDLITCSDAAFRLDNKWTTYQELSTAWKDEALPILEKYVVRTPGSYIDTKRYALIWHFENAEKELGEVRSRELLEDLRSFAGMENLQIHEAGRMVEIRNAESHKASMLKAYMDGRKWDFMFAVGDDQSNESMFEMLPPDAFTLRIGSILTSARYNMQDRKHLIEFLRELAGPT